MTQNVVVLEEEEWGPGEDLAIRFMMTEQKVGSVTTAVKIKAIEASVNYYLLEGPEEHTWFAFTTLQIQRQLNWYKRSHVWKMKDLGMHLI